MNVEELRDYCLLKEGVEECFPFDNETLVFKVYGKMFLLCSLEKNPISFNAKCNPDKAIELREQYMSIRPGYHMNKTHWNTIECDGSISKKLILELIDHSYELVYKKPKPVKK